MNQFKSFVSACVITVFGSAAPSIHAATIASYNFATNLASGDSELNSTAADFAGSSGFDSWARSTAEGGNFFTRNAPTSFNVNSGYIGFTVTAGSGYELDLSALSFNYGAQAASGSYTQTLSLRTSADGFAADLAGTYSSNPLASNGNNASTPQSASFDLSGAAFQNLSSLEVRIYLVNSASSNNYISRTDNVLLTGDVAAIPEPKTLWIAGLLGAMILMRRRRCD